MVQMLLQNIQISYKEAYLDAKIYWISSDTQWNPTNVITLLSSEECKLPSGKYCHIPTIFRFSDVIESDWLSSKYCFLSNYCSLTNLFRGKKKFSYVALIQFLKRA